MSTKAFDFYIFDKEKLVSFLNWSNKNILKIMGDRFIKNPKLNQLLGEISFQERREILGEISKSMQSMAYGDDYDLDLSCGVSIWIWRKKVVVRLFGLREFLDTKRPSYVKNFEYWNNTDKPDEIDSREWARRENFFDKTLEKLPRMEFSPFNFLTEYGKASAMSDIKNDFENNEENKN